GAFARGLDLHAGSRLAHARRREHPLALDLDHAGAAIPIGAVTRLREPAEMRDLDALAVGDLPDRLTRLGLDFRPVEGKADRIAHVGSLSDAPESMNEIIHLGLSPCIAAMPEIQQLILVSGHPSDDLGRHLSHGARRQAVSDDCGRVRYRDRKLQLGASGLHKVFYAG